MCESGRVNRMNQRLFRELFSKYFDEEDVMKTQQLDAFKMMPSLRNLMKANNEDSSKNFSTICAVPATATGMKCLTFFERLSVAAGATSSASEATYFDTIDKLESCDLLYFRALISFSKVRSPSFEFPIYIVQFHKLQLVRQ